MRLTKLSYQDFDWEVSDLEFVGLNLIVAKNSTGKSRTLMTIDLLLQCITQRRSIAWGVKWVLEFLTEKGEILIYEFVTSPKSQGLIKEKITINDKVFLTRNNSDEARILSKTTGEFEEVFPPSDKLLVHVMRDVRRFPFLEEIAQWADNSFGFKFAHIHPNYVREPQEHDFVTQIEDFPNLFAALDAASKKMVIDELNSLGYQVEQIVFVERGLNSFLEIKEKNLKIKLLHYRLSQGMFRALAIIISLEYLITRKKPAMVTIDDLCEGLDYSRASKLGKLVFDKCENSNVQLIATSNDSFLMDAIDIKYWNILRREGKKVTALNIQNSEALFNNFRFTGLSNFDLLSSDYLIAKAQ
jgi:AAA15 family ATPase/GTPase